VKGRRKGVSKLKGHFDTSIGAEGGVASKHKSEKGAGSDRKEKVGVGNESIK